MNGILDSNELFSSKGYEHARYGDGQYLSDIDPNSIGAVNRLDLTQAQIGDGKISLSQLSTKLIGRGNETEKFSYYVEIDISDLPIMQGVTAKGNVARDGVLVHLSGESLSLDGRIVASGKVIK